MMEEIKKIVDSIKTYPEVVAIILYGSHAKNKANPLSDIDIAVSIGREDRSGDWKFFLKQV